MQMRPLYVVAIVAVAIEVAATIAWLVWRWRQRKAAPDPESGW